MSKLLTLFGFLFVLVALSACGDKATPDDSGKQSSNDQDEHTDGEDADGEHTDGEHADGDADDDHDDHNHGARVELGSSKAGDFGVTLALLGEIEAGHEAVFDIEIKGGVASALRAWVGIESGRGSLKAKIDGEDGDYHGHAEVPAALPEGSAIWVEVEAEDGTKSRTSFKAPTKN